MSSNSLNDRIKKQQKAAKTNNDNVDVVLKKRVFSDYAGCKICAGTLYDKKGNPCMCKTKYMVSRELRMCNVGDGFVDVNLDFYSENFSKMKIRFLNGLKDEGKKKSLLFVNDFVEYIELYAKTFENRLKDGMGFILSGDCGGGKTSAAIYIIKELCKKNYERQYAKKNRYNMFFIDVIELLDTIKETWDNDSPNKYKAKESLEKLSHADLLVIDDLGAEYAKSMDWLISILLKIIKGRTNKNLPTIITTNFTPQELLDKFSEKDYGRLASVLSEKFEIILMTDYDDVRTLKRPALFKTMKKEV